MAEPSPHVCTEFWRCVYAYQTLIAGVLAIGAAAIAAWLAYRQLNRMTVQSNAIVSNLLREHIGRLERSRTWLVQRLTAFDLDARRRFDEFEMHDGGHSRTKERVGVNTEGARYSLANSVAELA